MKNTISLFGGSVTINKAKADYQLSILSYAGMYFARILLIVAAVIFFVLTAASGGDGRMNDGNPLIMFINLGLFIFCSLCARLVSMLMEMIEHGYRVRRIKRKYAKLDAQAEKASPDSY